MQDTKEILEQVFGYKDFRPGQEEIVSAVTAGRDTLAIMPTGGGKSLCYQLPALRRDGVTIVISPLIALMRDQVRALKAVGVSAGALTSGNTDTENDEIHTALNEGILKLLYIAPERLASSASVGFLRRIGTSLIAVDEAHCVSQWGHDFRPDYLRIGALKQALDVPLVAFTATADADTRGEIIAKLFSGEIPDTFLHGFDRPNIYLAFERKASPRKQILAYAAARTGRSGIIYCGTRAKTESIATALSKEGHSACCYHAGLAPEERRKVEERFATEDGLIVVGTVAFGMGVDKPDVRWVAHADLPKSIEAYYQEIGRAGRDGAPAEAFTLYGAEDIRLRRQQIDEGAAPDERKNADHGRLNALLGLAEGQRCRRSILLGYFGEVMDNCGACDLCESSPKIYDATVPVQKALSAILRTEERFGASHVIDVLLGHETDKVRQHGHHQISTFGAGTEFKRSVWQGILLQMCAHDLIRPESSRFGAYRMTASARPILRGESKIHFREDGVRQQERTPARALVSEGNEALLSALKSKRRQLADARKVPAYVIFPDKTLIEMAERRPGNLDELSHVSGVGSKKLERFGPAFLEVLRGEEPEQVHPARRKLAGKSAGLLFDRLLEAQSRLVRGSDGTSKPLDCPASLLARVAETKPLNIAALSKLIGDRRAERFAEAFLEEIRKS